jgi:hypothetical protein
MKKQKIALLPMDDRPVNYDYPGYLARAAGCKLLIPPREWLGNPWRVSQHARLVDWVAQVAQTADAMIIAIDTLAYGGLIPSRTSREARDYVLERLAVLRRIKIKRASMPILAFNVIQRVSRHNSSEEEKNYWAYYGSDMFRLSYLEHKVALGDASPAEVLENTILRAKIPQQVYEDYRQGRSRNHAVNQAMLDWLAEGVFDYLLLPQDDTADYGWNIAEARALQVKIRALGLSDRAIVYPGADEIGCLLLASALCRQAGYKPSVWPRYSSIHSANIITAYEDRPIHELLKAHLAPLNGVIAASPESADLLLFVNAPSHAQGEGMYQWLVWRGQETLPQALLQESSEEARPYQDQVVVDSGFQATRREMESSHRNPEEFVRALWSEMATGRPVALADVAFVNGADLILGNLLMKNPQVAHLSAYGGWNTAGNTLGCVLAQAVLRTLAQKNGVQPSQTKAHLEFLFLRFLDDYFYQARERTLAWLEDLPSLGLPSSWEHIADSTRASALSDRVHSRLTQAASELEQIFIRSGLVSQVRVNNIHLPWQRLFEMGCEVEVTLASQ